MVLRADAQIVVGRMLERAEVSEDDVVYDLGSGDGQFVIPAAQQHGARGIGIEIDSELIRKTLENPEGASVSDRVEFRQGDLFEADGSIATVAILYLLPTINLQLRPTLLEHLEPGARVGSHDFDMNGRTPDSTARVGEDAIYLWSISPDVPDSLKTP